MNTITNTDEIAAQVLLTEIQAEVAGAARYWTIIKFNGPNNSSLLREILRVKPARARDLWCGRIPYRDEELETLQQAMGLPRVAFTDLDEYLGHSTKPGKGPGAVLAVLRAQTGLTVKETARRVGCSKRHLQNVESGMFDASAAWLGHVASVLSNALVERALRAHAAKACA